jgi:hypothetical protein
MMLLTGLVVNHIVTGGNGILDQIMIGDSTLGYRDTLQIVMHLIKLKLTFRHQGI